METTTYTHELYESGDDDCPGEILDANGEVCLGQCRICGKAESDLDGPCVPKVEEAPAEVTFTKFGPDRIEVSLGAEAATHLERRNDRSWYDANKASLTVLGSLRLQDAIDAKLDELNAPTQEPCQQARDTTGTDNSQRLTQEERLTKAAEVGPGGGLSDLNKGPTPQFTEGDLPLQPGGLDLNGPKLVNYEEAYHKAADQVLDQARRIEQLELTPKVVPCKGCSCELLAEKDARIKELEERVQLKEKVFNDYYNKAVNLKADNADLIRERDELRENLAALQPHKAPRLLYVVTSDEIRRVVDADSFNPISKVADSPQYRELDGILCSWGKDQTVICFGRWNDGIEEDE
jgi:hypothetical protein